MFTPTLRKLLCLALWVIPLVGQAQIIRYGEAYGYRDTMFQQAVQSVIDQDGARYTMIQYDYSFQLDSAGVPITIEGHGYSGSYNTTAIVKFDQNGRYLYHITIVGKVDLQMKIDFNNQLVIWGIIWSTTDLLDSKNVLYKRIVAFNASSNEMLIIKTNGTNGLFQWANTIKISPFANYTFNTGTLTFDKTGNSILGLDVSGAYTPQKDTLTLTYSNGKQVGIPNTSEQDLFLSFSDTGALVSYVPAYKLKYFWKWQRIEIRQCVSDGQYLYSLVSFYIDPSDTLLAPIPLALKNEYNHVLIKSDNKGNTIWVRLLGSTSTGAVGYTYTYLDYDSITGQLITALHFPGGVNVMKMDTSGTNTWNGSFNGFAINHLMFNHQTGGFIMLGIIYGNATTLSLRNYTLAKDTSKLKSSYFIAYFDKNNYCHGAEMIQTSPTNGILVMDATKNEKGVLFITGRLNTDLLWITCNKYFAARSDVIGPKIRSYVDGFVLWTEPPGPIIDTMVCKRMLSPSRKHYYDSSGFYVDTLLSSIYCDSMVIFHVNIGTSRSIIDTLICKNYMSPSGKFMTDTTTSILDTIPNHLGCDSLMTIRIKRIYPASVIDTFAYNHYLSPSGKYYTDTTTTIRDTVPNYKGCDSLMTIHVHILHAVSAFDTVLCNGMKSPGGKYMWDSSGIYTDTIPNYLGIDSIITVNLKVAKTHASIDKIICDSMQSPSGRYTWKTNGTYWDTIPNHTGCDSIISVRLTLSKAFSYWEYEVCDSLVSPSKRFSWKSSGTYTDTVANYLSCDSIITIKLEVKKSYSVIDTTYCGDIISPSYKHLYANSGIYTDTIPNTSGCDSILTIKFKRVHLTNTIAVKSCTSPVVSPSGKYQYTVSGTYLDTVPSVQQCDSIITLNVIVDEFMAKAIKSNDITCDTPFALLDVTQGVSYKWYPPDFLSDPASQSPTATPKQQTMYYVQVTDNMGCNATDSIEVHVNKTETVSDLPNAFTPNNDGINDCLSLQSISTSSVKNFTCTIFNRWGSLVFESTNSRDCWGGKNRSGQDLDDGVYYFVLKGYSACGTEIVQNGTIQLIR